MNVGSYWLDDEEGEWAGRRASEQLGGGTGSSEGTSGRESGRPAGCLHEARRRQRAARELRPARDSGRDRGAIRTRSRVTKGRPAPTGMSRVK